MKDLSESDLAADIIIAGAGLAGLMAAWRLLHTQPEVSVLIIDVADEIAGDHTWSCNASDILPHLKDWLEPFFVHRWDTYGVKFPKFMRVLNIPYRTGTSDSLRACVQPYIEAGRLQLMLGTKVKALTANTVTLAEGTKLSAKCVCDARGFVANESVILGYQKFVGHTIKTATPHGVTYPIIMDATVPQLGGYRFVYCLPFTDTQLLVEDTYYTDGPTLDADKLDTRITEYIRSNLGITDSYQTVRKERGVLPITLAVDKTYGEAVDDAMEGPVLLGMRGGYYHAVTGYSLPEAVKSANVIAEMIEQNEPNYAAAVHHEMTYHKRDHYHEERFLRLLNRMLFRAANPEKRYKVLQRFYSLSEGLVARFYRNRLTKKDKLRLLIGKPPVPVSKAIKNLSEQSFIARETKQG